MKTNNNKEHNITHVKRVNISKQTAMTSGLNRFKYAEVDKKAVIDHERRMNAKRNDMYRCPVCGVYESFITNVHCVNEHQMTKAAVEARYGKIIKERLRKKGSIKC